MNNSGVGGINNTRYHVGIKNIDDITDNVKQITVTEVHKNYQCETKAKSNKTRVKSRGVEKKRTHCSVVY